MSARSSVLLAALLMSILLSTACGANQRARGEPRSTEPPGERVADKATTGEQTTAEPTARKGVSAGTHTEGATADVPKRPTPDDSSLPQKQDRSGRELDKSSRPPKPDELHDDAVLHGPNIMQQGAPGDVRQDRQKAKGPSYAPNGRAQGSNKAQGSSTAGGRPPDLAGSAKSERWLPERCLERLPGPKPKWCDKLPQSARTPTR